MKAYIDSSAMTCDFLTWLPKEAYRGRQVAMRGMVVDFFTGVMQ